MSMFRRGLMMQALAPKIEAPIPDCYYDFSQGSNDDEARDTIKDLSGNGNDAVAHGFAWNEEGSGYKDGALYFDGVDDYVSLDAFDSGFKTMFMVCKPFKGATILYDQRGELNPPFDYAVYNDASFAYYSRNANDTFINGVLNTKILGTRLINIKHLININSKLTELGKPFIGSPHTYSPFGLLANMALYKFLGFKEELTEEQIKAVIKKYNLLDGVDEIEVN